VERQSGMAAPSQLAGVSNFDDIFPALFEQSAGDGSHTSLRTVHRIHILWKRRLGSCDTASQELDEELVTTPSVSALSAAVLVQD
jgi:hypothetical protein